VTKTLPGDGQTYAARTVEYCRSTAKAITAKVILRFLSILRREERNDEFVVTGALYKDA
jgi:hypothetical protein